jgi:ATP-dependent Clp protease adaptor protein ClpS
MPPRSPTPAAPVPVVLPIEEATPTTAGPWNVILHDDDVTTMEFVVHLLVTLFGKPFDDAVVLMLEVHHGGVAVVATCSQERAELYVEQVRSLAAPRGFPLTATCEPA